MSFAGVTPKRFPDLAGLIHQVRDATCLLVRAWNGADPYRAVTTCPSLAISRRRSAASPGCEHEGVSPRAHSRRSSAR